MRHILQDKKLKAVFLCAILVLSFLAGAVVFRGPGQTGLSRQQEDAAREGDTETEDYSPNGVWFHGGLAVDGGRLVGQYGEDVQLRGVSSHGILWYPQYGNYRSLETLHAAGANVFRIAMYTSGGKGYDKYPDESYTAARGILENALATDMYVIIDWHVLDDKDPNVYIDQAISFFDKISALYAGEPAVIYEICNEPNSGTSWDAVKNYAERVIPVIRKNSPDAVILVGTPHYSTGIKEAADAPLDFKNVLYSYHYYADSSQSDFEASVKYAMGKGIGIFVSECGIGNNITQEDASYQPLIDKYGVFLDFLDREGISWVSWALSNKDEGNSLLKPEAQAWSGWTAADLTGYGQYVFARLED